MTEKTETIEPEIIDESAGQIEHVAAGRSPVKMTKEERVVWMREKIDLRNLVITETIRASKPANWINQGGTPYPMEPVASILLNMLGNLDLDCSPPSISNVDWSVHEDEKGKYKVCEKTCTIDFGIFGKATNTGHCSTRDLLLGTVKGELRPMHEVSLARVSAKCTTRAIARTVFHHFGFLGLTWESITKFNPKITPQSVKGVKYQGSGNSGGAGEGSKRSPQNKAKIKLMNEMLDVIFPKDAKGIKEYVLSITGTKKPEWAKERVEDMWPTSVAYHYDKTIPAKFFNFCRESGYDPEPFKREMETISLLEKEK